MSDEHTIEALQSRAAALALRRDVRLSTVSKWIFGRHDALGEIVRGERHPRPIVIERAFGRLADHEAKTKGKANSNGKQTRKAEGRGRRGRGDGKGEPAIG